MSADATASRWHYPSVSVDDPGRALGDLADTIPLVDDLAAILDELDVTWLSNDDAERCATLRRELLNLRRRLEAVHARLVS